MLTKAWLCPSCGREFIVARDAERDTCPWCKTTVQERAGNLEKVPGVPPPPPGVGSVPNVSPAANPSGQSGGVRAGGQPGSNPNSPPGPIPNVAPGPHAGSPSGGPSPASPHPPSGRVSGEMWWPYDYDPF